MSGLGNAGCLTSFPCCCGLLLICPTADYACRVDRARRIGAAAVGSGSQQLLLDATR